MIDGDGRVTIVELSALLTSLGHNTTEAELQNVETSGNGTIDFPAFLTVAAEKGYTMDEILNAFKQLDEDGSGTVTAAELKSVMTKLGERSSQYFGSPYLQGPRNL